MTISAKIQSHKDLLVWQQAMDLAVGVYVATRAWPRQELIAQGSPKEVETHLIVAQRTGMAEHEQLVPLLDATESVGKLLRLLLRRLSKD